MHIDLDELTRKLNAYGQPNGAGTHLRRWFCADVCLPEKKAVLIAALKEAIEREEGR
jgi:hypothetical protein